MAGIALFCIGTASAFGWLLAYFRIPQLVVNSVASFGGGITSVGFITAAAFLFIPLLSVLLLVILFPDLLLWLPRQIMPNFVK